MHSNTQVTICSLWTFRAYTVLKSSALFSTGSFGAARLHAGRRVVLMSSASVHLPHDRPRKVRATADWTSASGEDHLYDLTKRIQEEIARDFCWTFGMDAVVLRAGHIVDG